jgi:hypothetical protein
LKELSNGFSRMIMSNWWVDFSSEAHARKSFVSSLGLV